MSGCGFGGVAGSSCVSFVCRCVCVVVCLVCPVCLSVFVTCVCCLCFFVAAAVDARGRALRVPALDLLALFPFVCTSIILVLPTLFYVCVCTLIPNSCTSFLFFLVW